MFFAEGQESKAWVQELYAVIQSLRVSQKIYPSFQVLQESDQARSEGIL